MKKVKSVLLLIAIAVLINSTALKAQESQQIDSIKILLKTENQTNQSGRHMLNLGALYIGLNMIDSAEYYENQALNRASLDGDSSLMANIYSALGTCNWYRSDFVKATEYYVLSARMYDLLGMEMESVGVETNMGLIHLSIGEPAKAKSVFTALIPKHLRFQNYFALANIYNYIGAIYDDEQQYDSAIYVMEECVKYARLCNSAVLEARGISGLGIMYAALGDFKKAIEYQYTSLELEQKAGNELGVMETYIILGSLEARQKNYRKAEEFYLKAQSSKLMQGNYVSQGKLYQQMTNLYDEMGDEHKSYETYRKLVSATDSIKNMDKIAIISELNEKYNSEKKANEILNLKKDQELASLTLTKERTQKTLFGSIAVFFFLIIVLVIYGYVQLRKTKNQLDVQNKKISQINDELNLSQEELMKTNQTKDKLFALVAHDLRGPVTSLQGVGKMMDFFRKKGDEQRLLELTAQIDQSTNAVNQLLDNLLKWALSQTQGLSFQPKKVVLGELIKETVSLYNDATLAKNITCTHRFNNDTEVFVDFNMITTVFRNLLSNAIKFSPPGGEISLNVDVLEKTARISVTDSGAGMPQETIERILKDQAVSSTRGTSNEKGTGLGLALCREFVKKHGGDLDFMSSDNGTTISFQLALA